jgi:hypothetical protein
MLALAWQIMALWLRSAPSIKTRRISSRLKPLESLRRMFGKKEQETDMLQSFARERLAEDRMYELVLREIEQQELDPIAEARALEEAQGDVPRSKALYIKHRIRRIIDLSNAKVLSEAAAEAKIREQLDKEQMRKFERWYTDWVSVDPVVRGKIPKEKCREEFTFLSSNAPMVVLKTAIENEEPGRILDGFRILGYSVVAKRTEYGLLLSYQVQTNQGVRTSFRTSKDLIYWAKSELQQI